VLEVTNQNFSLNTIYLKRFSKKWYF